MRCLPTSCVPPADARAASQTPLVPSWSFEDELDVPWGERVGATVYKSSPSSPRSGLGYSLSCSLQDDEEESALWTVVSLGLDCRHASP
jgi:hypothetical protein